MLPQTVIDALIIIGMFVLRIGLPLAILLVLGSWLEKKLNPQEMEQTERRSEGAHIIPFRLRQSAGTPASTRTSGEETAKRTNVK